MRLRLMATAAATSLLTLTACSSTDSGKKPPETSDTPSATQTTTGTLLDNVPRKPPTRPEDVKSEVGAKAFAAYVPAVLIYSLGTNDAEIMEKLADLKICATCKDFSTFVDKQQSKNKAQVVTEGSLDVSDAKVTSVTGGFYTVKEDVNYPPGADINNKTGKEMEKFPREIQQYSFDLQWRNGSWTLLEYEARTDVKD